jgi:hypothetical protein
MIFGISIKNYVEDLIFHQKIFFVKIPPVGDHSPKLSTKVLRGSTVEFSMEKFFHKR